MEDDTQYLGLMTSKTITHVGLTATSELDTDQGKDIWDQLQFANQQLETRFNLHMYRFSVDETGDITFDHALTAEKLKRNPHLSLVD